MAKYGVSVTNVQAAPFQAYVKKPVIDKSDLATNLNTVAQGMTLAGKMANSYADYKAEKEGKEVAGDVQQVATEYDMRSPRYQSALQQDIDTSYDNRPMMYSPETVVDGKTLGDIDRDVSQKMDILTKAKQQGRMGELELYERVMDITRDKIATNPYYTKEFIAKAKQTLDLNNIAKKIAIDNKYYDGITSTTDKENQKFLTNAINNDLSIPYTKDGNIDYEQLRENQAEMADHVGSLSKLKKLSEMTKIKIDDLVMSGEIATWSNQAAHVIKLGILETIKNENISGQDAKFKIESLFNDQINAIRRSKTYTAVQSNSDARSIVNDTIADLEKYKETLVSHMSGKDYTDWLANEEKNSKNSLNIKMYKAGLTIESSTILANLSSTASNLRKLMASEPNSNEKGQALKFIQQVEEIFSGGALNQIEALFNSQKIINEGGTEIEGTYKQKDAEKTINEVIEFRKKVGTLDSNGESVIGSSIEASNTWFTEAEKNGIDLDENTVEIKNMKAAQNSFYGYMLSSIDSLTSSNASDVTLRLGMVNTLNQKLAKANPDHLYLNKEVKAQYNEQLPEYLTYLNQRFNTKLSDPGLDTGVIEQQPNGSLVLQGIARNQGIGKEMSNVIKSINQSWLAYSNVNGIERTTKNANDFFSTYFRQGFSELFNQNSEVKTYGTDENVGPEEEPMLWIDESKLEDVELQPETYLPVQEGGTLQDWAAPLDDEYNLAANSIPESMLNYIISPAAADSKSFSSPTSKAALNTLLNKFALSGVNVKAEDFKILADAIGEIEASGKKDAVGSSGKYKRLYYGKFQMGRLAIADAAKDLGVAVPNLNKFLKDEAMQERFYTAFIEKTHRFLMGTFTPEEIKADLKRQAQGKSNRNLSPSLIRKPRALKYRNMSAKEKLEILAGAQLGMDTARLYLNGDRSFRDGNGKDMQYFIDRYKKIRDGK